MEEMSNGDADVYNTSGSLSEDALGGLFAVIFFIAVLFAAITSLMNLFEIPIEALQEQFKLSRKTAVGVIALISAGVGIFIESGDAVGAWMSRNMCL